MSKRIGDHVGWLTDQGHAVRQSAEKVKDEKYRAKLENMAARLFEVADALEMLQAGIEPDALGGHRGLQKRFARAQEVHVLLMSGGSLAGVITALGRYDFALRLPDGRELVVPKHAVMYWELLGGASPPGAPGPDLFVAADGTMAVGMQRGIIEQ